MDKMDFSTALGLIKEGCKLTREGWNGRDQYVTIQKPYKEGSMSEPYIYIRTQDLQRIPWLASQADLLADDWVIYERKRKRGNFLNGFTIDEALKGFKYPLVFKKQDLKIKEVTKDSEKFFVVEVFLKKELINEMLSS